MNKTILCSALLALIHTPLFADNLIPAAAPTVSQTTPEPINAAPQNNNVTQDKLTDAATLPQNTNTNTNNANTVTIDCHYHIPAQTTNIDQNTLKTWASQAILQSFDLNFSSMDRQLDELKNCYTEQGWQSFNDALVKSGNIDAIKTQQLNVTAQVDGQISLTDSKQNQWRVSLPLQVTYQNAQEKVLQHLTVDILLGRKVSGDLGIMQMIATPRNNAASMDNSSNDTIPTNTQPVAIPSQMTQPMQ